MQDTRDRLGMDGEDGHAGNIENDEYRDPRFDELDAQIQAAKADRQKSQPHANVSATVPGQHCPVRCGRKSLTVPTSYGSTAICSWLIPR
jgi:hypothetical protein